MSCTKKCSAVIIKYLKIGGKKSLKPVNLLHINLCQVWKFDKSDLWEFTKDKVVLLRCSLLH